MSPTHILITGACGAIGRHCVAEARCRSMQVSGLGHGLWEAGGSDETIDFWTTGDVNIPSLMHAARKVNDAMPQFVVDKVRKYSHRFRNPVIACLGLTYKADVDDLRQSPALDIVIELAGYGEAQLLVVEPHLNKLPQQLADFNGVEKTELKDAMNGQILFFY